MAETKVLIAFYSRTGVTDALAAAIAEGARTQDAEVQAAHAMNARHEAPSAEDAVWADAIIFGTPTRFGAISSELKVYVDGLGGLWAQGKLMARRAPSFVQPPPSTAAMKQRSFPCITFWLISV